MLPTLGLFRSIPCPYYVSGLCERPHCLFRHTKSDVLLARKAELKQFEEDAVAGASSDEEITTTATKPSIDLTEDQVSKLQPSRISNTVPVSVENSQNGHVLENETKGSTPRKRPSEELMEAVSKRLKTESSFGTATLCMEENANKDVVPKVISVSDKSTVLCNDKGTKSNESQSGTHQEISKVNLVETSADIDIDKSRSSSGETEEKSGSRSSRDRKKSSSSKSSSKEKLKSTSKSNSSHQDRQSHSNKSRGSSSSSSKSSKTHSSCQRSPKKSSSHKSSSSDSSKHNGIISSNRDKNKTPKDKYSDRDKHKSSHSSSEPSKKSKSNSSSSNNGSKTKTDRKNNSKHLYDIDECVNDKSDNKAHGIHIGQSSDGDFSLPDICDYSDYNEDDPEDIELECLRMFEDYKPAERSSSTDEDPKSLVNGDNHQLGDANTPIIGRRRMAHLGAVPQPITSSRVFSNHLQIQGHKHVVNHGKLVATVIARVEEQNKSIVPPSSDLSLPSSSRKRIAHVPNAAGLARPTFSNGDSSVPASTTKSSLLKPSVTPQITVKKGTERIAHKSTFTFKNKGPIVMNSTVPHSSKIVGNVRQKVLDQLYLALIGVNHEYAFKRALYEEAILEKNSRTKPGYLCNAVNRVRTVRKEFEDGINPDAVFDGDVTKSSSKPISVAGGNSIYKSMSNLCLSAEELLKNGFPREHATGEPGRAEAISVYWSEPYVSEPTRRTCDRCRKVYSVKEDGSQINEDTCVYHSGRKNKNRVGRSWTNSYTCCGSESGTDGCCSANYHVPKSHPVNEMKGFISAIKAPGSITSMGNDAWDIVALDCEMIYTTSGNQLARATFLGVDGIVLYDELVKPRSKILDYNTKFSGLTEEILKNAKATLTDVQAVMMANIKPNSILIGHSLESDLIALRFKHKTVIDTSVMFPHRMGPPLKRALRNLTSEYLQQLIQNSEYGHDSAEDARAALNLVKFRIAECEKSGDHKRNNSET